MPVVFKEEGIVCFSGQGYRTDTHAHFALELAFATTGYIDISGSAQDYNKIKAAIISPNALHSFDCLDGACFIFFIDPTSKMGEYLFEHYNLSGKDIVALDESEILRFKNGEDFSLPDCVNCKNREITDRIYNCTNLIEKNISEETLNIRTLSKELFVSESRLAHLFKEEMGISIQQYILWKKLETAFKRYVNGHSLTDCAHFSGFSDSSHLNKTFRKMFGIHPSFANKK